MDLDPVKIASTSTLPAKRPREPTPSPPAFEAAGMATQKPANSNSKRFKNSIVLAPMVRSSTMPTRLLSLKYGATLVWGPEIVDRAMLVANRVVNSETGVISYEGISSSIWTSHPVERPWLIYQIGTANPTLAVQAAMKVAQDVSGVDLNCGCPKPFSTTGGMGAALLDTPDLLCDILKALRKSLPRHLSVSCKIRLLPTQEATLKLVKRIVTETWVDCLTIHCRTRNMRKGEKAIPERMKEVVEYIRQLEVDDGTGTGSMKKTDIAILANGDCLGYEDAKRLRDITGADGVMIATAAESNPSCFQPETEGGIQDADTVVIPEYLRLAKTVDNNWGGSKHCIAGFKSGPERGKKKQIQETRRKIAVAKGYDDLESLVEGDWDGRPVIEEVRAKLEARGYPEWWHGVEEYEKANPQIFQIPEEFTGEVERRPKKKQKVDEEKDNTTQLQNESEPTKPPAPSELVTPEMRPNPEPAAMATPFFMTERAAQQIILDREPRSPSPERSRAMLS